MAKNVTSHDQEGGITAETVNIESQSNPQAPSVEANHDTESKIGAKTWIALIIAVFTVIAAVINFF